jgi:hypothetical protein
VASPFFVLAPVAFLELCENPGAHDYRITFALDRRVNPLNVHGDLKPGSDLARNIWPRSKVAKIQLTEPELDPLVGPVGCSSSQVREHGSSCSPWIRAANAEGGISPNEECGLTSL